MARTAALMLVAPADAAISQSFVFRHCVRQTANEVKYTDGFDKVTDFSKYAMPDWGVPEDWCTAGGMKLAAASGADLVARFGVNPDKLYVSADIEMRDGDTAIAFLTGMKTAAPVLIDGVLYSTDDPEVGTAVCAEPNKTDIIPEIKQRLEEVPMPWDLNEAIEEFESVFGVGRAGSMKNLGNNTLNEDGKVVGPVQVLKELAQNLLYSYASNITKLYEETGATYEQVIRFYAWQAWYRSVTALNREKAIENTHLLSLVLDDLLNHQGQTGLHFGHDGNQDAFALFFDLVWEAPPFMGGKLLPTPPNTGLRFVHDDKTSKVDVSLVYHNYTAIEGAQFSETHLKTFDALDFVTHAMASVKKIPGAQDCFDKAKTSKQVISTFNRMSGSEAVLV